MKAYELIKIINEGRMDEKLSGLYGAENVKIQRERYADAIGEFVKLYGTENNISIFSVPGRSEISGNHTDHNHGKVIAASIDLDIIAIASPRPDSIVKIKSQGFPEDTVDTSVYTEPDSAKYFSSESIIAGMAKAFKNAGCNIGGYQAYTTSNVFKGSGLSSSAAFEVMVGNIFNYFFNDGNVSNVEIAKMSQYAENEFFGKPCGLMDQTACAVGGFVTINFADPKNPVIEKLPFDLSGAGYALCITNTGGNHADLNQDYASVPAEMKAAAKELGKPVLNEVDEADFIAAVPQLREKLGDRAIMRAIHFFEENKRVDKAVAALKAEDIDTFLQQIIASGNSSFKYLQNVYTNIRPVEQGLSLALLITELAMTGKKAAYRVHGGGFAGTIQAFIPLEDVESYKTAIENVFGKGSCYVLHVRAYGAIQVI